MMTFRKQFTPRSNLFKEYLWIWFKILLFDQKRGISSFWTICCPRLTKIPESTNCLQRTVIIGTCLLLPLIKTYTTIKTQRGNCHYMVLLNDPVDKQQILTLSRQMHLENPQHLLRHIKEATSKPYEYLMVDLKPTPPEHLRIMNTKNQSVPRKLAIFETIDPTLRRKMPSFLTQPFTAPQHSDQIRRHAVL